MQTMGMLARKAVGPTFEVSNDDQPIEAQLGVSANRCMPADSVGTDIARDNNFVIPEAVTVVSPQDVRTLVVDGEHAERQDVSHKSVGQSAD